MTVGMELFEAVSDIQTTGNTVCSLSHSLIVHMAFNGLLMDVEFNQNN